MQIVANPQQFESAILVAVSKTANPLEGWHFMVIPAARSYEDRTNCFPDYPSMAASVNKLTVSTNIACYNTATGSIRVAGHAFWVVPKAVPGKASVYEQVTIASFESQQVALLPMKMAPNQIACRPFVNLAVCPPCASANACLQMQHHTVGSQGDMCVAGCACPSGERAL